MTPDAKARTQINSEPDKLDVISSTKTDDEDNFFDLLSRFQSKRMDDQRCSLNIENKENTNVNVPREGPEDLMDMIVGMQSKRMDEQRVSLSHLPGNLSLLQH